MNKLLIAAAAAFFAVAALFGSDAQAGFNMRLKAPAGFSTLEKAGCGGGYRRRVHRRRYQSTRRVRRKKVHIARKAKPAPAKVAKVESEDEAKPAKQVAEMENSSIATASGKVAKASEPKSDGSKKVAAVKEVGCKQFFPSVGMTLSVPCE